MDHDEDELKARNDNSECEKGYVTAGQFAPNVLAQPDSWVHRSLKMKCATCMWFVLKATCVPTASLNQLGRCRRHAPTMNGYPVAFQNDWCGDHKLDENK